MTNPLDDYLGIEKTAAPPVANWARKAGEEMYGGALSAIGAGAVGLVGLAGLKIRDAALKRMAYNEMLEQDADLQAYRKRDPKQFNRMYNSLRAVAPNFANDPIIAASTMRNLVGAGDGQALGGTGLTAAAEQHSRAFGKPSFKLTGNLGVMGLKTELPL